MKPQSGLRHASVTRLWHLCYTSFTPASLLLPPSSHLRHILSTPLTPQLHLCLAFFRPSSCKIHGSISSSSRLSHGSVRSPSSLREVSFTPVLCLRHASTTSLSWLLHSLSWMLHVSVSPQSHNSHTPFTFLSSRCNAKPVCPPSSLQRPSITHPSRNSHTTVSPLFRLSHASVTSASRLTHPLWLFRLRRAFFKPRYVSVMLQSGRPQSRLIQVFFTLQRNLHHYSVRLF
jgi:hypothetical protein